MHQRMRPVRLLSRYVLAWLATAAIVVALQFVAVELVQNGALPPGLSRPIAQGLFAAPQGVATFLVVGYWALGAATVRSRAQRLVIAIALAGVSTTPAFVVLMT